jgi:hypothetical protein
MQQCIIRWCVVVCRDDHGVRGDAHAITNSHAAVAVDDRKRIQTAIVAYSDVSSVREEHREWVDLAVTAYLDAPSIAYAHDAARCNP